MSWEHRDRAIDELRYRHDPPALLVRDAVRGLARGASLPVPKVIGDVIVRNGMTVAAHDESGRRFVRVLQLCAGEEGGPAMANPIHATKDQRLTIDALIERCREMEGDDDLSAGRALELASGYLLSGDFGWPGEPLPRALREELELLSPSVRSSAVRTARPAGDGDCGGVQ